MNSNEIIGKLNQIYMTLAEISESMNRKMIQQVISPSDAAGYLRNGWRYVGAFGDGNYVVVEIDERERR